MRRIRWVQSKAKFQVPFLRFPEQRKLMSHDCTYMREVSCNKVHQYRADYRVIYEGEPLTNVCELEITVQNWTMNQCIYLPYES